MVRENWTEIPGKTQHQRARPPYSSSEGLGHGQSRPRCPLRAQRLYQSVCAVHRIISAFKRAPCMICGAQSSLLCNGQVVAPGASAEDYVFFPWDSARTANSLSKDVAGKRGTRKHTQQHSPGECTALLLSPATCPRSTRLSAACASADVRARLERAGLLVAIRSHGGQRMYPWDSDIRPSLSASFARGCRTHEAKALPAHPLVLQKGFQVTKSFQRTYTSHSSRFHGACAQRARNLVVHSKPLHAADSLACNHKRAGLGNGEHPRYVLIIAGACSRGPVGVAMNAQTAKYEVLLLRFDVLAPESSRADFYADAVFARVRCRDPRTLQGWPACPVLRACGRGCTSRGGAALSFRYA
ncbi:hypothetical protein C8R47DRAFT_1084619, partial [Mycena vitilis]